MTKEQLEKKIKEILKKDSLFDGAKVHITYKDKRTNQNENRTKKRD